MIWPGIAARVMKCHMCSGKVCEGKTGRAMLCELTPLDETIPKWDVPPHPMHQTYFQ